MAVHLAALTKTRQTKWFINNRFPAHSPGAGKFKPKVPVDLLSGEGLFAGSQMAPLFVSSHVQGQGRFLPLKEPSSSSRCAASS